MAVRRRAVVAVITAASFSVVAPTATTAGRAADAWQPGPATYGVTVTKNVPVTMPDGVVLRVDVYRPADLATGEPVTGAPFPVLLTQTPYGKSPSDPAGTGPDKYLISHGYIQVVADIRGRGGSEGYFEAFGSREIRDGVELVQWASTLESSTGTVGLVGGSYLGINQLLTAEAIGPNSPLKAIFPPDASNSNFRDLSNVGGMPSLFGAALGGVILPPEGAADPIVDYTGDLGDTVLVEAEHAGYLGFLAGGQVATQTGSPSSFAYYNQFWDLRDPGNHLDRIVATTSRPSYRAGCLICSSGSRP